MGNQQFTSHKVGFSGAVMQQPIGAKPGISSVGGKHRINNTSSRGIAAVP